MPDCAGPLDAGAVDDGSSEVGAAGDEAVGLLTGRSSMAEPETGAPPAVHSQPKMMAAAIKISGLFT